MELYEQVVSLAVNRKVPEGFLIRFYHQPSPLFSRLRNPLRYGTHSTFIDYYYPLPYLRARLRLSLIFSSNLFTL